MKVHTIIPPTAQENYLSSNTERRLKGTRPVVETENEWIGNRSINPSVIYYINMADMSHVL